MLHSRLQMGAGLSDWAFMLMKYKPFITGINYLKIYKQEL